MSRRFALLAGINDYGPNSGLQALRFAEADAILMAQTLEDTCGFETLRLLGSHATVAGITEALPANSHQDLDLFLFFFAGHGEYIPAVGLHCLHCYGSKAGDTIGAIRLTEWEERIRNTVNTASSLVVVDACRNEVYRGVQQRGAGTGLEPSLIADVQVVTDRDIGPQPAGKQSTLLYTLLSCGPRQVSYEDAELGHGVFTHALTEEVRAGGARRPMGQLRKEVGGRTVKWCNDRRIRPVQMPYWIEPSLPGELFLTDPVASAADADSARSQERVKESGTPARFLCHSLPGLGGARPAQGKDPPEDGARARTGEGDKAQNRRRMGGLGAGWRG
jgi:uncharacterized caspase-like protein